VTGTAYSRNFPVTDNAYQKVSRSFYTPKDGAAGTNGVITELNPTGSALVYSTYLGGSYWDGGRSIGFVRPGPHPLAVGAGKDGSIYVVDRNGMGKLNSVSNNIYQQLPRALPHGEWGMPAWFNEGCTTVAKATC
jgi:Tol biopolymer transport system component